MEARRRRRIWQILAAMFLFCSLALSLTSFSLRSLIKAKDISEPKVLDVSRGSIFFNGEELEFQLAPGSTTEDELLQLDMGQSDQKGMIDDSSNKVGWRNLNTSFHCGHDNMTLKIEGPYAAKLQLDLVSAHSLPVIQVPESCDFSVRQNPLGVVLVVQYDGCNVRRENGRCVLPLRWQKTRVNFTCMLQSSPATPLTTPEQERLSNTPLPNSRWRLHRSRRHVPWQVEYRCYPHYPNDPYFHHAYSPTTPPPTTATTTTTTTTITPPTTVKPFVNLDFWRQLLEHYPVYARYLAKNTIPVNIVLDFNKKMGRQQLLQGLGKPKGSLYPLQHLLGYQPQSLKEPPTPSSPTPRKLKPTPRSIANPDLQKGFEYFYRNPLIQKMFKDRAHYQNYKPGLRPQVPDWSFPAPVNH